MAREKKDKEVSKEGIGKVIEGAVGYVPIFLDKHREKDALFVTPDHHNIWRPGKKMQAIQ